MESIKVMLTGIMFALVSLFFLGVRIINMHGSILEMLAVICIIIGIVLFFIGLFVIPAINGNTSDNPNEEGYSISKTECPNCKNEHDIDYPKCPNCNHKY